MNDLKTKLETAAAEGLLLESSVANVMSFLDKASSGVVRDSITELVEKNQWDEINDRFYRTLAFGTGGLRGRSIGRIVTDAERGTPTSLGRPQFPCVGTNAMNDHNIRRAAQGLAAYAREWMQREGLPGRPKIVVAHDTRHFSREFAELTAKVASENGCDAALFEGPRSTPELSFALRHLRAHAGVVITASHNPPHDNGFKVYFADGAQIVEPHASGIIAKVNSSDGLPPAGEVQAGGIETLGDEIDEAYIAKLETLVLDPEIVRSQRGLSVVYSSIHGTGGIIILPLLERFGVKCHTVPEQEPMDGRFPTVKSPNPENEEALSMAINLAKAVDADLVLGTDPDCDRVGVAIRNRAGEMSLLTGNQIGALLAWYRVKRLFETGVLNPGNAGHAVIIKTFVTSDLQKAIAERSGLHCVETLTGFKYIGQKMGKYENALPPEIRAGYRDASEVETRRARLEFSRFFVFGGEESYGYSGADFVRDKDGNGSALMIVELAAYAKSWGGTVDDLLDEIWSDYGYYAEQNGSLTFEGADGAEKIARLVESYNANRPTEMDGAAVESIRDFASEEIRDCEGERVRSERLLMFTLADGRRIAVRPSGTEPKIKFYLFARREADKDTLAKTQVAVDSSLDSLWRWVQVDADARAG